MSTNNEPRNATTSTCDDASTQHQKVAKNPIKRLLKRPDYTDFQALIIRCIVWVLTLLIGFFVVEFPANEYLFQMKPVYALMNLTLIGIVYAIIYFIGNRTHVSQVVFLIGCFFTAFCEYFMIHLKGVPPAPSDLLAISTAAEIAGGLTFQPNWRLVFAGIVVLITSIALHWTPKPKHTKKRVLASTLGGVALLVAYALWLTFGSLTAHGLKVDNWSVTQAYYDKGISVCFTARWQDMNPGAPKGYSHEKAQNILAEHQGATTQDLQALSNDLAALSPDGEAPTVIAIMNETFADMSIYPGMDQPGVCPTNFYAIANASLQSGFCSLSALGAGTCNSEFEFLSGNTLNHMPSGAYPFVIYNMQGIETLVSYFDALEYETHAIHPAEAKNWKRDVIFPQMGFDDFHSIETMGETEKLREKTTDRATYELVEELLDSSDSPQFIFDVTYMNHSGYKSGLLPEEMMLDIDVNGESNQEVNEYQSILHESDLQLREFIENLEARDENIVVIFFGDHQPSTANYVFNQTKGYSPDSEQASAAESQMRYQTPYFIWANYDIDGEGDKYEYTPIQWPSDDVVKDTFDNPVNTSVSYLGANALSILGFPTTSYQNFLLEAQKQIPNINDLGYQTSDGTWHWGQNESMASEMLATYAIVQYDAIFGKQNKDSLFVIIPEDIGK